MEKLIPKQEDDIWSKLNKWMIRGQFPEIDRSSYYLVISKTKEKYQNQLWLVEIDPDEDGWYPKRICIMWDLGKDDLNVGDCLHINLLDLKKPKVIIEKKAFDEKSMEYFMDWVQEQLHEKYENTKPLLIEKPKEDSV